jgi:hypothetical protein
MKNSLNYVEIILNDYRDQISSENPTVFEDHYLERIYEFVDGAIVSYEWRDFPAAGTDNYNHRFTLTKTATQNTENLKLGVLRVIKHPNSPIR